MWPTCSEPLTVGGGVSMANTAARSPGAWNRYVPSRSQTADHVTSRPSRDGRSGTFGVVSATRSSPHSTPTRADSVTGRSVDGDDACVGEHAAGDVEQADRAVRLATPVGRGSRVEDSHSVPGSVERNMR